MSLSARLPILRWARSYQRGDLSVDVVAGAALWALVVPQSVAYATLADVPVQHGLYAMVPALLLYALFGPSSRVVVGVSATTAALSPLVIASVTDAGAAELVLYSSVVSLAVGCVFLALGLLRMGWIANFLSAPVVSGFITGFGITLAIGQLPKMLGISADSDGALRRLWLIVRRLDEGHGATVVVGAASLAVLFGLRRVAPKVPGALVVVVAGIVAAKLFDLADRGVSVVGEMPSGLPDLGLPDIEWSSFPALLLASVAITIVGLSELLGASEAVAHRHGEPLDLDQEFLANGVANIGSGLMSGIVVNGSLSKTAANDAAGARTQVSGIVAAALGLLTLLFLTGVFADLPDAVLGAVVFQAALGLIDIAALRDAGRIQRVDLFAAIGALVGTLVSDILTGMIIGVALSLILLIRNASQPPLRTVGRNPGTGRYQRLDRHPDGITVPGVLVARIDGSLFFASSMPVATQMRELAAAERPRAIVVDFEAVGYIDITAIHTLRTVRDELEAQGIELHVVRVHDDVRDVLDRAGTEILTRGDRIHDSFEAALRQLESTRPDV